MMSRFLRLLVTKPIRSSTMVMLSMTALAGPVQAGSCIALTVQKDRSPGATVVANECRDDENLALGSVVQMNGGARLWLKSQAEARSDSNFQVICQNKSIDQLQIEVVSPFLPWIKPKNVDQCGSWAGDRLSCNDAVSGMPILFCAIARIRNLEYDNVIQRKTSVTMRGVVGQSGALSAGAGESADLEKIIDSLRPEVDLCKKVFQSQAAIALSWTIGVDGRVHDAEAQGGRSTDALISCALDVVRNFAFPPLTEAVHITHNF